MSLTTTTSDLRHDLISVYLRRWKSLRSFLKRRTGSHELAEDALQETWLKLADLKPGLAPIRDQEAFILRIAGNIAIDLARRENRHGARCISDEALLEAIVDSHPSPETIVIDRDRLRFLALALARLPAKARTALLLSRCDGMAHAEIARRLDVSESMVARYLAQALRHCRDHFRDEM